VVHNAFNLWPLPRKMVLKSVQATLMHIGLEKIMIFNKKNRKNQIFLKI